MSQNNVAASVSIHQNSFEDSSSYGPQVFYFYSSASGKALAGSVLSALNASLGIKQPRQIKANKDYFILKKSTSPSVIVECGFLSNPDETLLLSDKTYQKKPPLYGRFSCFLFIFLAQHVVLYFKGFCNSFFKILFRSCSFRAGLLTADSGEFIPLSFTNVSSYTNSFVFFCSVLLRLLMYLISPSTKHLR